MHTDGTYRVKFPGSDVNYTVSKPTQTEVLQYATAGKNGAWLSVLEKAFAQYRGRELDAFVNSPFFSEDAFKSINNPKSGSYPLAIIPLLTLVVVIAVFLFELGEPGRDTFAARFSLFSVPS